MFSIKSVCGKARTGILQTRSSKIKTPFFMPVATFATGRMIGAREYEEAGVQTIISNSYLLSLRPGTKVVEEFGGIGKFMGFKGSLFADSGGFQSSSSKMHKVTTKNGVHLQSPFDGSTSILTPKHVMDVQQRLGSDVAMVIDDMAMPDSSKEAFAKALRNTHNWAKACKELHTDKEQLLFAINQGGYDRQLRMQSAEFLSKLDFDGYAIGGCAIGEPKPDMYRAVTCAAPLLPEDKPRYLMGVGSPADIVECVGLGVDCFDSIFPTMNARHGRLFTFKGTLDLNKGKFKFDNKPIEDGCDCFTCKNHTRGYVRHLASINEGYGKKLMQIHNIRFMMRLMQAIRTYIAEGTYSVFRDKFLHDWFGGKIPKWHQAFDSV